MASKKPRLLRITTVPVSLKLLLDGQMSFFQSQGFDVLAVSADGPEVSQIRAAGIAHRIVPMTRKITPWQDFVCILALVRVIREFKPDIVHTHTPKAGLLGMLAAWICGVRARMHTVAGLPVMEASGLKRRVLIGVERLTYLAANQVFPKSRGLLDFINREIAGARLQRKMSIIGKGSSNGINTRFFARTDDLNLEAVTLRAKYGINSDDIVFCFVGRVVKDKGIHELMEAFKQLSTRYDRVFLFLVGPFEQDLDPLLPADYAYLHNHSRIILPGFQEDVRPWIAASDVFTFPSYREGFPNVVMQACCLSVPCIVSDINGCNEIIRHGQNGLIVPTKDSSALFDAMDTLTVNKSMRQALAAEARRQVVSDFGREYVWNEILARYQLSLRGIGWNAES